MPTHWLISRKRRRSEHMHQGFTLALKGIRSMIHLKLPQFVTGSYNWRVDCKGLLRSMKRIPMDFFEVCISRSQANNQFNQSNKQKQRTTTPSTNNRTQRNNSISRNTHFPLGSIHMEVDKSPLSRKTSSKDFQGIIIHFHVSESAALK